MPVHESHDEHRRHPALSVRLCGSQDNEPLRSNDHQGVIHARVIRFTHP